MTSFDYGLAVAPRLRRRTAAG